jgi:toxin secretion/phage lysis holin
MNIGKEAMRMFNSVVIALVFNGLDILSGFIAAIKEKRVQSSKLRDGLFKKVGFIFCYGLAILVDLYGSRIGMNLGVDILPIIIAYVGVTETVSIVENICRINSDLLPDKLLKLFHLDKREDS